MIVKESEAGSKICPLMSKRVTDGSDFSMNRNGSEVFKTHNTMVNCQGASCMAWRETYKDHGFCGMTNTGEKYTSKEDRQLESLWRTENDV